ncbi:MAG: PD40 domain-containing protein [Bacteroidales bacterium]|nr:PD40 domain-containing protein [Bacteroidales bacterium]
MNSFLKQIISLAFLFTLVLVSNAQETTKLLRFPAIHNNNVVFSYAGDIYSVDSAGGTARQLTFHDGYEMFARFSPDGKTIAFTGQYDGNTEIFSMPAEGGNPKRLTYTATLGRDDVGDRMGPNNMAITWTKDGKYIVYRSRKESFNSFVGKLYKVSVNGGLSEELPLPAGGFCSFSDDGNKLAYNQVMREFRTWKYYKGGMADDVRIYDFKSKQTENITKNVAQDIFPMWYKNRIYFASDRNRIMNIFVYDTEKKTTEKVTDFKNYDVKFPSIGGNRIIFENGGELWILNLDNHKTNKISIKVKNDLLHGRNKLKDARENIGNIDISPDGNRIVVSARGDVFTVPSSEGITRNLTRSSGSHDRNAAWSPDGKNIAYISDRTGEDEIYIQGEDGKSAAIQLTKNSDTYKYFLKWSPDSKKILWSDKKLRLLFIDVESKVVTEVAKSQIWEYNSFNWSPDSKWITYQNAGTNGMGRVMLYNVDNKKTTEITDKWYNSGQPVFSDNGKYLFFVSGRDFNPTYSATEWNHSYNDMNNIYFITLAKETQNPLSPKNDEVNKSASKDDKTPEGPIKVDLDGIQNRIANLPLDAGNYWALTVIGENVYYIKTGGGESPALMMFSFDKKKETKISELRSYSISHDKKKMMLRKGKQVYVADLPKAEFKPGKENELDISNLKVMIDNKQEWQQIYYEAWRQMRDFFYDPGMHGVNWEKIKNKYSDLLSSVNHRTDLNYLIGEMIGELNVGHAYINGGDITNPERIKLGLLGAKIISHKSGYYKIEKILDGENWRSKVRSPLTEIGVNIKEGDYIFEIDGVSVTTTNDIYSLLVGKAGKHVEITSGSSPDGKNGIKSIVVPIEDEADLYYFNWVRENIRKVEKATNGEVGYIHIPDMVTDGLNEFAKYFYPQLDKKAIIIDGRGNGGGNVSPMIIERLQREMTRANISRNVEWVGTTPRQMMLGPKVLLIDQYSASDGDLFPYAFKKHNIGKVIGVRSWGGVVGIRGSLPFVDGADLRKPEFASFSSDGKEWIIEGWGVEPDIIIENDPAKEYAGEDQQLNKAIETIMEELKIWKIQKPEKPDFPDKSK